MSDSKKAKKEEKPEEVKATKGGKDSDGKEPAEGAEGAAEGEAVEGKRKLPVKKLLLFVALPLFLIVGGGAGAYFTGMLDSILPHKPPTAEECASIKEGDKKFAECVAILEIAASGHPGAFLNIPDMIVNLNSTSKQPRFLKVALKLEVESLEDQKKIEPMLPRVVDQFQMYLRELRIEDLRGTSGIYRMKIELLSRVRAAAPNVKVRDVLFQEILVQ